MSVKSKKIINGIMRWLLFGVFISALPPLFIGWFKTIVGRDVNYIEFLPDALLVVLSICCNLLNSCTDGTKAVFYILRWIFSILLGICAVICWGFYFGIYFSTDILKKIGVRNTEGMSLIGNDTARCFFIASTIIIVVCMFIGSIIEWRTAIK